MEYFNTTNENEGQETIFNEINKKQDAKILSIFEGLKKNFPDKCKVGASSIINYMPKNTPITSVRRSINTLWNKDLITRCDKVVGKYGRVEFTYQYGKIESIK